MKRKNRLEYKRLSNIFGSQLFYYDEIDSTMLEAKRLIAKGDIRNEAILIAKSQSGGKGRRGRVWDSPTGGMWFTYVIEPNLERELYPLYTLMSAVAIINSLEQEKIDAKIKWPNDIIIKEKKLAGIAIDLISSEKEYLLIGIGVNGYNNVIDTGISLASIKTEIDITEFLIRLINCLKKHIELLETDYNKILNLWRKYNNVIGKEVTIYPADQGEEYTATVEDIDKDGSLIVKYKDKIRHVIAADVSLRILKQGDENEDESTKSK